MLQLLLIAIGGAFGSVMRYLVSTWSYQLLGRDFPYGTLIVNVTGSFIMGFLFIILLERVDLLGVQLRALLLIGVLGGFTTFSSFSIETYNLLQTGALARALSNIFLSVVLCLLAVWCGAILGRQL